jgi:hypothetical protein
VVETERVSSKRRCKARAYALAAGCLTWLWTGPVGANGGHVTNRCPRLSAAEYEELDARVLLLVASVRGSSDLPTVVCTAAGAWVEWRGQRFDVVGRGALIEEVVDIVEAQLHADERQADANPKTTEAAAVAAGEPVLQRGVGTAPALPATTQPASATAKRAEDARGGGISAGFESELVSNGIGVAIGPAFDFAATVGPILLGGREAFRFTVQGRQLVLMDFEGVIAYGAPFNPDERFGAVARLGAEWMVAYPEGNSGQAAVAPVAELGLRFAHSFGLVGLWFGIDGRMRLQPLSLHSRGMLAANNVSGSLTLGVVFVDWSRK